MAPIHERVLNTDGQPAGESPLELGHVIQRIQLANWMNFREVDLPLAPRVFIVGKNAVGKSNLLQAFCFLRDIADQSGGGLQAACRARDGFRKLRSLHIHGGRSDLAIEVDVGPPGGPCSYRYRIAMNLRQVAEDRPSIQREQLTLNPDGPAPQALIDRPDAGDQQDPQRLYQTHLEQVSTNQPFRGFVEFLSSITYLHPVPRMLREGQANTRFQLGRDPLGRDLLAHVARTPERSRRARLAEISKILQRVVPNLDELSFATDEHNQPHLQVSFSHWRKRPARQQESQFSDGTIRLIAMLWAIRSGTGVLLLEEPELSLHAEIVRSLPVAMLKLHRKGRRHQVIATTHSLEMLADPGISPEEVVLITPGKAGSNVARLTDDHGLRELMENGLTAAEVLSVRKEPPRGRKSVGEEPGMQREFSFYP